MSDYLQGDLLAQAAMDAAVQNSDEGWLRAAKQELAALIRSREPWTTDIVWFRLEALGVATAEPRALGGLIRSAARAGLIVQRGYRPSVRPEAHARPICVWQAAA